MRKTMIYWRFVVIFMACALCLPALSAAQTAMAAPLASAQTAQSLTVLGPAYPGDVIHVTGFGYQMGETVTLTFAGAPAGTTIAQQARGVVGSTEGYIATTISIPDTALVGANTITATGQTSKFSLQGVANVQANWRQEGFAPSGGRNNINDTAISVANVSTLTLAWKWTSPNTYSTGANAPSEVGGVLYMGTGDSNFHAFNATTGTQVWDTSIPVDFNNQPSVSDDVVYSAGYNLYAFDRATGKLIWDTGNMATMFLANPTLANGTLYAADSQHVYAFNAAGCGQPHCSPMWSTTANGQNMTATPVVANGVVYVVSQEGTLFAYNASTGSQIWSAVTNLNHYARTPAVVGDVVYVASTDNNLYAFNAKGCGFATCTPLWTAAAGGPLDSIPAVANGVVYVGSDDFNLYAFNASGCSAATCSPLWTAPTGGMIRSSPAVVNGVVYVGSYDHAMYAFDAKGCNYAVCSSIWSAPTGDAIWGAPIVVNGMLFFTSRDNSLYAFRLQGSGLANSRPRLVPGQPTAPRLPTQTQQPAQPPTRVR